MTSKLRAFFASAAVITVFSISPAFAQDNTNPMADVMGDVTIVATALQATVLELQENISSSANSAEEGTNMLDEMLSAATDVNDSLDEDSEVWQQLNALLADWSIMRDDLSQRATENPALQNVADLWQQRVENGIALRTQILDQASASKNLVVAIEAQREVVLAYFEVDAADQVLASMQQMSDQLGQMNTEMQSMLEQAGVDVPQASVTQ
jgi:hypothetical protein